MRTLLAILLLASTASADMWEEWMSRREVGPRGRYYVVLRYDDPVRAMRYAYARIGPGSPPVESHEFGGYQGLENWSVGKGLREGDQVLATGGLETPSYSVLVSATGLGFVGVEEWWGLGRGNSVTIVKADGGSPVTCRLRDLFTVQEITDTEAGTFRQ